MGVCVGLTSFIPELAGKSSTNVITPKKSNPIYSELREDGYVVQMSLLNRNLITLRACDMHKMLLSLCHHHNHNDGVVWIIEF